MAVSTAVLGVAAGLAVMVNQTPANASTFKTLHAFSFSDAGYVPTNDLVLDARGNIYGTTALGDQSGTVFSYAPSSGALQFIANFNGAGDGNQPQGALLVAGGNLFGTTESGGPSNAGTIFRLDIASQTLTTLHTFSGAADGVLPYGGLTLLGGKLFGVTLVEGERNGGTLFSIPPVGGTFKLLYDFDTHAENAPVGKVVVTTDGTIYGVVELIGKSRTGALYAFNPASGKFTVLHAFTVKAAGSVPFAGIALFENALYGTTFQGGQHNFGTVWKYDLANQAFTVLHSFAGAADGEQPQGRPVIGPGGRLYGTAYAGGASNDGTVYAIDLQTGKFRIIHDFQGTDGQYPEAGVTLGKGGILYGTTALGGENGGGTLFSISPNLAAPARP